MPVDPKRDSSEEMSLPSHADATSDEEEELEVDPFLSAGEELDDDGNAVNEKEHDSEKDASIPAANPALNVETETANEQDYEEDEEEGETETAIEQEEEEESETLPQFNDEPLNVYKSSSSSSRSLSPNENDKQKMSKLDGFGAKNNPDHDPPEYDQGDEEEGKEEVAETDEEWTLNEEDIEEVTDSESDPSDDEEYHSDDAEPRNWMNSQLEGEENDFPEESEEEQAVIEKEPSVDDEEFIEDVMNIPEIPAREALSKEARSGELTSLKDPRYPWLESDSKTELQYESQTKPRMHRCPSIESFLRMKPTVDVYFYVYPGKKLISRECRLDAKVHQIKQVISRFLNVPGPYLDLRRNRNLVNDNKTLNELGARPQKKFKMTVDINHRASDAMRVKGLQLEKDKPKEFFPEPDSIRYVTLQGYENVPTKFIITTIYPTEAKQMIGGFIDQRTLIAYHHAQTGTILVDEEEEMEKERDELDYDAWEMNDFHRGCQTFSSSEHEVQTTIEKAIQMERDDYYISSKNDRVIFARSYISHDMITEKKIKAVLVLQKHWRRWLAVQAKNRRLEGLIKRIEWVQKIKQGRMDQRYEILQDELRRQQNPKNLLDLELLYRAITNWRDSERKYIMLNRWGAERKAALALVTEMEGGLLLELERIKVKVIENTKTDQMHSDFKKMGAPKRWIGSKSGHVISIDSHGREFARKLHELFKALQGPVYNTPEGLQVRTDLLLDTVKFVGDKRTKFGVMLLELVGRELIFIKAKSSNALLSGVRRRISNTFYCMCKDPEFNPEAVRSQKIPSDNMKLRKDMLQCKSCRRMQYRDEFTIIRGTTVTKQCHTCSGLYRTAILRVDLNLYRQMLTELRKDEYSAGVTSSVLFLMDAYDMRFLFEQIWHGQSALSGIDNRYFLRLCRWHKEKAWAPWNCVLLTEEESLAHQQIHDIDTAYQPSFFHSVSVKHSTAKSYFEGLSKGAVRLDGRIEENCEKLNSPYAAYQLRKKRFKQKQRTLRI